MKSGLREISNKSMKKLKAQEFNNTDWAIYQRKITKKA